MEKEQIRERRDLVRYIKDNLKLDFEAHQRTSGGQKDLDFAVAQTSFIISALNDRNYSYRPEVVMSSWRNAFFYASENGLRFDRTGKAILAVGELNHEEWERLWDYMPEYLDEVLDLNVEIRR